MGLALKMSVIVVPDKRYPVREASSHAASPEHAFRNGERYLGYGLALGCAGRGQTSDPSSAGSQVTALSVRSNLVLVPALVKTKGGELVFELTADDFILTDNGVPQSLQLEPDTDTQPVALAIIVQTGGGGASHLGDYRGLDAVLDAVVGNVPHRVAVVSFDSKPRLERDFTTDTDVAIRTIGNLQQGTRARPFSTP